MIPTRKHYDIEGAADYLGCSQGDLKYHLKEGTLRYAVPKAEYSNYILIPTETLPKDIVDVYQRLRRPDLFQCSEIKLYDFSEDFEYPDYLYFCSDNISNYYIEEMGNIRAHQLETYDQQQVSIWLPHHEVLTLFGVYVGQYDESKVISNGLLSKDELDRLAGHDETKIQHIREDSAEPFMLPKKSNDVAITLCMFANRFYKQHSLIPHASELITYMLSESNGGGSHIAFSKIDRDTYDLNGQKLTVRNIKERLKSYLNNVRKIDE